MNKSIGMLGLALLCGLGAMYGTIKLISKDKAPVAEKQDVIVALRDLKIEEVIKPELVKTVQMDKTAVPMGAFSSIKDVEDRWVKVDVLKDEPLIDRKLAAKGDPPGLTSRIEKGMRAFSMDITEQSGVAGFVLPGHRVDVVQVEQDSRGKEKKRGAEAILQDVLVLATGQTFTRPEDRSVQSRTVTLALTPEQVETVVAAKQHGTLTLSLRGANDHEQLVVKREDPPAPKEKEKPTLGMGEVVVAAMPTPPPATPAPVPPPPAPAPRKVVWIYRGFTHGNPDHAFLQGPNDDQTASLAGNANTSLEPEPTDPIAPKGVELK